nr:aldehyde dehydrogenase family protein [Pseudoalteromonas sp. SWN29]
MKEHFIALEHSQPRGVVFHITPANVDTVYFYSLLLSMLCGNCNIVRISDRSGEQTYQLIALLNEFLLLYPNSVLNSLCVIVSYSSDTQVITEHFSEHCDMRIIWGGDDAIAKINQQAHVQHQVCFPDRYSLAVIRLTTEADIDLAVSRFIRDFNAFSQQACSSPKAILWYQTSSELQHLFWQALRLALSQGEPQFSQTAQANRLYHLQQLILLATINILAINKYHEFMHCELVEFSPDMLLHHQGDGLVLSCQIQRLDLEKTDKLQTISYFGLNTSEQNQLATTAIRAIALGQALTFDHYWDGVDLLAELSC